MADTPIKRPRVRSKPEPTPLIELPEIELAASETEPLEVGPAANVSHLPAIGPAGSIPAELEPAEREREALPLEPYVPPSAAESVRRSGLAWSMGIVFFVTIAFMLLLGWGADLLFGSSPWGLVAGIVFGSIMGFVQFFRTSSRIYNPEQNEKEMRPLLSSSDDDVD